MHSSINLPKNSSTSELSNNSNDTVESGDSFEETSKNTQQSSEDILYIDKLSKALEQQQKEKSESKKREEKSETDGQLLAGQNNLTLAQQKQLLMQQQKNSAMALQSKSKSSVMSVVGQNKAVTMNRPAQPGKTENTATSKASTYVPFAKVPNNVAAREPVDTLKAKAVTDFVKPESGKVLDNARSERVFNRSATERGIEPPAVAADQFIDNSTGQVNIVEQSQGAFLNPQVPQGVHASLTTGYRDLYKNWANYYRVYFKNSSFFVVYDSGAVHFKEEKSK